ncbi:MAG: N-formylglutamate amidohydrolase [Alphaproteobacteria bacterium]|nr:MAG: N-formylglutamate amidohydrolase [Alphaproteobacteria bacterium]
MDAETPPDIDVVSHEVITPQRQNLPLVFASPHSGAHYPLEFIAASQLDPLALRRSEDSFVDELFGWAPRLGAPLIRALFPRAMIDANREPYELDPGMFEDALPPYANTASPRVAAGLGTIARVVANGADIYRTKLRFAEALRRLRLYYWPYHRALGGLINQTRRQFGGCILIDCHSMPSVGGPMDRDNGHRRVDFVLGNCHGTSCAPVVIDTAERTLRALGYHVARNAPYAGGFVTRHYGRPIEGVHTLQIEINRALYMDEARIRRGPGMAGLAADLRSLIAALGRIDSAEIRFR